MKKFSILFRIMIFASATDSVRCDEKSFLGLIEYPNPIHNKGFEQIGPNERDPAAAIKIFESAPAGLYAGLGTERVLIGASLSPKVNGIVHIDLGPNACRYNRINRELFRNGRYSEYLNLRFSADSKAWIDTGSLTEEEYNDWQQLRQRELTYNFENFNSTDFRGANYLRFRAQFEKIHFIVSQNRHAVEQINLSDSANVETLVNRLAMVGEKISILDLSNAWRLPFMSKNELIAALELFSRVVHDDGILLITKPSMLGWEYRSIKFSAMRKQGIANFVGSLQNGADPPTRFRGCGLSFWNHFRLRP